MKNLRETDVKVNLQSGVPETRSRGLNFPDSKSTKSISTWWWWSWWTNWSVEIIVISIDLNISPPPVQIRECQRATHEDLQRVTIWKRGVFYHVEWILQILLKRRSFLPCKKNTSNLQILEKEHVTMWNKYFKYLKWRSMSSWNDKE